MTPPIPTIRYVSVDPIISTSSSPEMLYLHSSLTDDGRYITLEDVYRQQPTTYGDVVDGTDGFLGRSSSKDKLFKSSNWPVVPMQYNAEEPGDLDSLLMGLLTAVAGSGRRWVLTNDIDGSPGYGVLYNCFSPEALTTWLSSPRRCDECAQRWCRLCQDEADQQMIRLIDGSTYVACKHSIFARHCIVDMNVPWAGSTSLQGWVQKGAMRDYPKSHWTCGYHKTALDLHGDCAQCTAGKRRDFRTFVSTVLRLR
jgi:hypothetical protein